MQAALKRVAAKKNSGRGGHGGGGAKSHYTSTQASCTGAQNKCEALVKDTIGGMECAGFADIGKCIGAVLAPNPKHQSECCAAGTEYDNFLLSDVPAMDANDLVVDSETAIAIIDVQKDFTVGSFAQPCWGHGGEGFVSEIIKLVEKTSAAGGMVLASKDLHPSTHCSFEGEDHCKNTKNYDEIKFTGDMRYVNEFPSHCSFEFAKKGARGTNFATPQQAPDTPFCKGLVEHVFGGTAPPGHFCGNSTFFGAALDEKLQRALSKVPQDQVDIIFKGFNPDFDSFSAMPHLGNSTAEEKMGTGGYAMPESRAKKCHKHWNRHYCYPTKKELKDPSKHMRSIFDILNAKGIKKLYVVGLVYDFCVKETAIFGMEAAKEGKWNAGGDAEVKVIGNLARPSFDGKPGSPYTTIVCDGGAADGSFCTQGGGTTIAHQKHKADMEAGGVDLVRFEQRKCGA